ncbi:MAG: FAD-dependent oxidoreductase [Anaerolineae bacterium]|nr:FAD-dependent oxidoreductase [Anaerolineae bacterium]
MKTKPVVAVIGAGPAGLFGAEQLVKAGARVALLNRDIKPGGLAEYGIYYDKYTIKAALRKQFRKILECPDIDYYGNVTVGEEEDLTLNELRQMGFQAILVTVGAQGAKWLGLPGEELEGVYHAKDVIYYYNNLPPFNRQVFKIGKRVALVGVGNVMADMAHWLIYDLKVDQVIAVARRGPSEIKFDRRELEYIAGSLNLEDLDTEFARIAARVEVVGQDLAESKAFILSALERAPVPMSNTQLHFRFLSAPRQILGDENGRVAGLKIDDTELILQENGDTRSRRLSTSYTLDVDTVILCIGNKVSDTFGLPVAWNEFVKSPEARYPINGVCYEVYDPEANTPIEGVFVAGWAREASQGQVGYARKDATNCVKAMVQYLQTRPPIPTGGATSRLALTELKTYLEQLGKPIVTKDDVVRLDEVEQQRAEALGLEVFKFDTNDEMLAAIGKHG